MMGCDIARPAGRDGFALSKTDEKKPNKVASRRRTCLDVVIIAIPIGLFITWVFGIGMIVGRMIK